MAWNIKLHANSQCKISRENISLFIPVENGLSLVNSRTSPSYPCCLVTSPRAAVNVIPFTSQVNSVLPGRLKSVKHYILSSKLISLLTCKNTYTHSLSPFQHLIH